MNLVGSDVVVVGAETGGLACQPQTLLALAQLGARGFELFRSLGNSALELVVELLELLGFAVELGEDLDLGAQDFRHHWNGDVVDRPAVVAADIIDVGEVDR